MRRAGGTSGAQGRLLDAVLTSAELRARRRSLGLTQAGLASTLGVTPNTVARWERGEQAIGHPERIERALCQLACDRPGGIAAGSQILGNLPAELSSIVGRAEELRDLRQRLRSTRLLTLTGPGGVGKTRLAVRLAGATRPHFPHGVWFVDLAPIIDSGRVAEAVGAVLGVQDRGRENTEHELSEYLAARRVLLVLDNCEHLVDACADLVATLLARCPGVQILATSRESLSVSGEIVWPVPPLEIATQFDCSNIADAVQLFVVRAQAVRPNFVLTTDNVSAVTEACRCLDGIPLALELAAAQMRTFGPEHLPALLADRFRMLTGTNRGSPPRQRALRATIDWSYDLLKPDERQLLNRLSVFAGGWTLESAQVVRGSADDGDEVPSLISRLVASSLVIAEQGSDGDMRFRLLETIRQYAADRLVESGEERTLLQQHAFHFLDLVREFGSENALLGATAEACIARIERELDNIRTAFRWAMNAGEASLAIGLAEAMSHFWETRGYYREGRRWLEAVLVLSEAAGPKRTRAALLYGLARCAHRQGDFDMGGALQQESLAISRAIDDPVGEANALFGLAFNASGRGQHELARTRYTEALSLYRRSGNRLREASSLVSLAVDALRRGDYALARSHSSAAGVLAQALGSERIRAGALQRFGEAAYAQGDFVVAERALREAVGILRRIGVQWRLGYTLEALAVLVADGGRREEAWGLLLEAAQVHQTTGEAPGVISCVEALASLVAPHAPDVALTAAGAVEQTRHALGLQSSPRERQRLRSWQPGARAALGGFEAEQAVQEGRLLPIDDALARVVQSGYRAPSKLSSRAGGLTLREREVLNLLAGGATNREIADALVVSIRTVERHVTNIYAKIGARGRADATAYALRHSLLDASPA
jgi:non-specific serine/threonine protein kinase